MYAGVYALSFYDNPAGVEDGVLRGSDNGGGSVYDVKTGFLACHASFSRCISLEPAERKIVVQGI